MAYSNINKDKAQVKLGEKLKTTVIGIILGVIAISAWINIWQQVMILNGAKNRNHEAENKITELTRGNKIMEKQIEYATSSANLGRKIKEYLGLGEVSDHWLVTDLGSTNATPPVEIPESGTKTILRQWWEMFAK